MTINRYDQIVSANWCMAEALTRRSTCLRRQIGAVAILSDRVVATGFNGQVSGTPHCSVCIRETENIPSGTNVEVCRSVHAEENVVAQAALFGQSLKGATLYTTTKPCFKCWKLVTQAGIQAIAWLHEYPEDRLLFDLLADLRWGVHKSSNAGGGDMFCAYSDYEERTYINILRGRH